MNKVRTKDVATQGHSTDGSRRVFMCSVFSTDSWESHCCDLPVCSSSPPLQWNG